MLQPLQCPLLRKIISIRRLSTIMKKTIFKIGSGGNIYFFTVLINYFFKNNANPTYHTFYFEHCFPIFSLRGCSFKGELARLIGLACI